MRSTICTRYALVCMRSVIAKRKGTRFRVRDRFVSTSQPWRRSPCCWLQVSSKYYYYCSKRLEVTVAWAIIYGHRQLKKLLCFTRRADEIRRSCRLLSVATGSIEKNSLFFTLDNSDHTDANYPWNIYYCKQHADAS